MVFVHVLCYHDAMRTDEAKAFFKDPASFLGPCHSSYDGIIPFIGLEKGPWSFFCLKDFSYPAAFCVSEGKLLCFRPGQDLMDLGFVDDVLDKDIRDQLAYLYEEILKTRQA